MKGSDTDEMKDRETEQQRKHTTDRHIFTVQEARWSKTKGVTEHSGGVLCATRETQSTEVSHQTEREGSESVDLVTKLNTTQQGQQNYQWTAPSY